VVEPDIRFDDIDAERLGGAEGGQMVATLVGYRERAAGTERLLLQVPCYSS
jgi:hypothetical protein